MKLLSFDLLLIIFAAINIITCWKAGFAASLLKFARIFLALAGAVIIGKSIGGLFGYVIGFVVIYIGVGILIKIMDVVTKIPIIHGIDKLLGFLFGVVCAFSSILALVTLASYIFHYAPSESMQHIFDSKIFGFMFELSKKLDLVKY